MSSSAGAALLIAAEARPAAPAEEEEKGGSRREGSEDTARRTATVEEGASEQQQQQRGEILTVVQPTTPEESYGSDNSMIEEREDGPLGVPSTAFAVIHGNATGSSSITRSAEGEEARGALLAPQAPPSGDAPAAAAEAEEVALPLLLQRAAGSNRRSVSLPWATSTEPAPAIARLLELSGPRLLFGQDAAWGFGWEPPARVETGSQPPAGASAAAVRGGPSSSSSPCGAAAGAPLRRLAAAASSSATAPAAAVSVDLGFTQQGPSGALLGGKTAAPFELLGWSNEGPLPKQQQAAAGVVDVTAEG